MVITITIIKIVIIVYIIIIIYIVTIILIVRPFEKGMKALSRRKTNKQNKEWYLQKDKYKYRSISTIKWQNCISNYLCCII